MENQEMIVKDYNFEFINEYDYFVDTNPNTSITYQNFIEKKLITALKELEKIKKEFGVKDIKKAKGNCKIVQQLDPHSMLVIGEYNSMSEASRLTGIDRVSISMHISNPEIRKQAGGFVWRVKK